MSLVGLPDFGRSLTAGESVAWRSFGRSEWLSLPHAIGLAQGRGWRPDLMLSMYRAAAPDRGPAPFGQLRATFSSLYDESTLLGAVRGQEAGASMHRALPAAGVMTLVSTSNEELADELAGPISAEPFGANGLRIMRRMTPEGASLFAQMIESGTMPISASLTLRYEGIAPRSAKTAIFDTRELAGELAERIEDGAIHFDGLAVLIEENLEALPIELIGLERDGEKSEVAAALADRIALRFADPLASRDGNLTFVAGDEVRQLRVSLDLSQPVRSARWLSLSSDPFEPLRGEDAAARAGRHISRSEMLPVPTGSHRVQAFANLAMPVAGLERLGVVLRAPAMPPMRPHAISTTAMFEAGALEQGKDINLAPGEEFRMTAHGFAIIGEGSGLRRVEGPAVTVDNPGALILNASDFGFRTATVEADHSVLVHGDVEVEVRYVSNGREISYSVALRLGQERVTLAVPLDALDPQMEVSLVKHGGGPRIDLGARALSTLSLNLPAFPSYGSHSVDIHCPGLAEGEFAAIDIVAADDKFNADEVETLTFSAERPRRLWRYFARDPFNPGFCWGLHEPGSVPMERWIASGPVDLLTIPNPGSEAGGTRQRSARAEIPSRPLNVSVDFGNGASKTYSDLEISAAASIHDVLAAGGAWEPPLACRVATLFTDRGGTDRNYLESVDGIEVSPRGKQRWKVEWDGKAISLDRRGPWAPGGVIDPAPVNPDDLPTKEASIVLKLVEDTSP